MTLEQTPSADEAEPDHIVHNLTFDVDRYFALQVAYHEKLREEVAKTQEGNPWKEQIVTQFPTYPNTKEDFVEYMSSRAPEAQAAHLARLEKGYIPSPRIIDARPAEAIATERRAVVDKLLAKHPGLAELIALSQKVMVEGMK
jgi:hypothetical protein